MMPVVQVIWKIVDLATLINFILTCDRLTILKTLIFSFKQSLQILPFISRVLIIDLSKEMVLFF